LLSKFSTFVRVAAAPIGRTSMTFLLEGLRPRRVVLVEIHEPPDEGLLAPVSRLDGAGEAALEIEARTISRWVRAISGRHGSRRRMPAGCRTRRAVEPVRLQWRSPNGQNGVAGSKTMVFSPTWTKAASESSWS
jgi:hypothetical protein